MKITKLTPPQSTGWTAEEIAEIREELIDSPAGIQVDLDSGSFRKGTGQTAEALQEALGEEFVCTPGPKGILGPYKWIEIRPVVPPNDSFSPADDLVATATRVAEGGGGTIRVPWASPEHQEAIASLEEAGFQVSYPTRGRELVRVEFAPVEPGNRGPSDTSEPGPEVKYIGRGPWSASHHSAEFSDCRLWAVGELLVVTGKVERDSGVRFAADAVRAECCARHGSIFLMEAEGEAEEALFDTTMAAAIAAHEALP